jgi:hypothetical protein
MGEKYGTACSQILLMNLVLGGNSGKGTSKIFVFESGLQ